jgi:hypothetical protein
MVCWQFPLLFGVVPLMALLLLEPRSYAGVLDACWAVAQGWGGFDSRCVTGIWFGPLALEATLQSVLGLLVVIRTFLSWALVVEIEGRWPWQGPGEAQEGHEQE